MDQLFGNPRGVERDAGKPLEPVMTPVVDELRLATPEREIERNSTSIGPSTATPRIGQRLSNLLGNALTRGASNEPSWSLRTLAEAL